MAKVRFPETLGDNPLEQELLRCQDPSYLEPASERWLAYGQFNQAAKNARAKFADWHIKTTVPATEHHSALEVITLHMSTCTLTFNGAGEGKHEISPAGMAIRGMIGFGVGEPVRFDIVEELFTDEGPRLVLNAENPDYATAIARNAGYIAAVLADWEEKKRQGLTDDYPISARATNELREMVVDGVPLNQDEFRATLQQSDN